MAEPSVSSRIIERNRHNLEFDNEKAYEDGEVKGNKSYQIINVKPTIHDRFASHFYRPGKYLNPYASPSSNFLALASAERQRRDSDIIGNHTGRAAVVRNLKYKQKLQNYGRQI